MRSAARAEACSVEREGIEVEGARSVRSFAGCVEGFSGGEAVLGVGGTRSDRTMRCLDASVFFSERRSPTVLIMIPNMSAKERLMPPTRSKRILVFILGKKLVSLFRYQMDATCWPTWGLYLL